jgi:MFS family permease
MNESNARRIDTEEIVPLSTTNLNDNDSNNDNDNTDNTGKASLAVDHESCRCRDDSDGNTIKTTDTYLTCELTIAGDDDQHDHDHDHQLNTPNHDTFLAHLLPPQLLEQLYPRHTPRSVQLLRLENIAVPLCYLCAGILQGLSGPFNIVYPLFLNVTDAQLIALISARSLPASFKILFGFFSDNVPFMGYRRKGYMFLGWAISSFSMLLLLFFSNLDLDHMDEPPEDAPSIQFLTFTILLFRTGFWFADVMGESLVAEKAKLEPEQSKGQLQSTCYACRFFGVMVAAPISNVLYSTYGIKIIVQLMAIVPLLMLYPIYHLYEFKNARIKSTRAQCHEIWNTVCSRAVWQPMGFVFIYNVLQVGNDVWKIFLYSVLLFQHWQRYTLFVLANVLLFFGVMAYKYYFIKFSWRSIYVGTTLLNAGLSLLQLLLIQGWTFGLSPFMIALGDDIFAYFIAGIQFLPTTIMMVHLCPAGSEGASYAMFTTVYNCALDVASALSSRMTSIWDVSKDTMVNGDLSGMFKLPLFTMALQTSGLLFVRMLPMTKDDLNDLHSSTYSGSRRGGAIFLAITILYVVYAVLVGLLNIVFPGWAGESCRAWSMLPGWYCSFEDNAIYYLLQYHR